MLKLFTTGHRPRQAYTFTYCTLSVCLFHYYSIIPHGLYTDFLTFYTKWRRNLLNRAQYYFDIFYIFSLFTRVSPLLPHAAGNLTNGDKNEQIFWLKMIWRCTRSILEVSSESFDSFLLIFYRPKQLYSVLTKSKTNHVMYTTHMNISRSNDVMM